MYPSPIAVHFFIVVLIFAGNNVLPPLLIFQIPLNGLFDSVCKLCLRQPAQFVVDLGRVDGITHIVALTVSDIGNQTLWLAQFLADQLDNVDVLHFIVTAYIVDFADLAVVDDEVNCLAVILYIQPVTHIFALAVNRQRLVCQGIGDHQRNQLFREVIRAIVVGASGNRYRETISSVVSQYQQICTCFRRGVGAAGVDGSLFGKEQVRSVQRQIAVDFVGRNLVITLDAILPASVHHNRCAEDVGLEEDLRVLDRAVYMRLRRKVDNDVGLFLLEELVYALTVADVQLDKSEVRIVHHRFQCGQIAGIGQLVQTNNAVVWVCFQHMKNEIGADKAGAASYDNGHDRYFLG